MKVGEGKMKVFKEEGLFLSVPKAARMISISQKWLKKNDARIKLLHFKAADLWFNFPVIICFSSFSLPFFSSFLYFLQFPFLTYSYSFSFFSPFLFVSGILFSLNITFPVDPVFSAVDLVVHLLREFPDYQC